MLRCSCVVSFFLLFSFHHILRLCSWNICLLASSSHLKEHLERKLASLIKTSLRGCWLDCTIAAAGAGMVGMETGISTRHGRANQRQRQQTNKSYERVVEKASQLEFDLPWSLANFCFAFGSASYGMGIFICNRAFAFVCLLARATGTHNDGLFLVGRVVFCLAYGSGRFIGLNTMAAWLWLYLDSNKDLVFFSVNSCMCV